MIKKLEISNEKLHVELIVKLYVSKIDLFKSSNEIENELNSFITYNLMKAPRMQSGI